MRRLRSIVDSKALLTRLRIKRPHHRVKPILPRSMQIQIQFINFYSAFNDFQVWISELKMYEKHCFRRFFWFDGNWLWTCGLDGFFGVNIAFNSFLLDPFRRRTTLTTIPLAPKPQIRQPFIVNWGNRERLRKLKWTLRQCPWTPLISNFATAIQKKLQEIPKRLGGMKRFPFNKQFLLCSSSTVH